MDAKKRTGVFNDAASLVAALVIAFLLVTRAISSPQLVWINFGLLIVAVILICYALSRLISWIHDYLFE